MADSPRTETLASLFSQSDLIAGLEPVMGNTDEYTSWALVGARATDRQSITVNNKQAYNASTWADCSTNLTSVSPSAASTIYPIESLKQQFDVCTDVQAGYSSVTEQFQVELDSAFEDLFNTLGESMINGDGTSNEILGLNSLIDAGNSAAQAGANLAFTDLNAAYRKIKRKSQRMAWVVGGAAHDVLLDLISTGVGGTQPVDVMGGMLNVPTYRNAPILLSDHVTTDSIYLVNGDFNAGGVGVFFGASWAEYEEDFGVFKTSKVGLLEDTDDVRYRLKTRVAQAIKHPKSIARVTGVS